MRSKLLNTLPVNAEDFLTEVNRQMIGADRLFSSIFSDTPLNPSNYPPYNIIKVDDNTYEMEVAVAGFSKDEIEVSVENGRLTVEGSKQEKLEDTKYIHKGIAQRSFKVQIPIADYIEVNDATVENGILSISMKKELPEYLKPKKIEIK